MADQALRVTKKFAQAARVIESIILLGAIVFFAYSAYAGTFEREGSTPIFTGTVVLLLALANARITEKVIVKMDTDDTELNE